jgi:predicted NBD/HSP70 family sugar kinase
MSVSGNALTMRELNINLVRNAVKTMQMATKQQIAEATGLSTVTVGTLIQQLLESGEISEVEQAPSSGGRPAHQFCFNAEYAHILVLFSHEQDGSDLLHMRVANLYGEVRLEREVILEDIHLDTFQPYIDECLLAFPTIRAIGFGLPGFEVDGKIIWLDYQSLMGERLTESYAQRYNLPVIFENDVNAAALGYCRRKDIHSEAAVVYAYFPAKYGPGSGIVIDGKLYKGLTNYAGEISTIPFGIDWLDPALYQSADRFCPTIAKTVVAMSSLLNPHSIILHGRFLTPEAITDIERICAEHVPQTSVPHIHLSEDFLADYQCGMIHQTLAQLDHSLTLTHTT